jgi:hypothetical protein
MQIKRSVYIAAAYTSDGARRATFASGDHDEHLNDIVVDPVAPSALGQQSRVMA